MAIEVENPRTLDTAARKLTAINAGLGRALTQPVVDGVAHQFAAMNRATIAPALEVVSKARESMLKSAMGSLRMPLSETVGSSVAASLAKLRESQLVSIKSALLQASPAMKLSAQLIDSVKRASPPLLPNPPRIDTSAIVRAQAEQRAAVLNTPSLLEELLDVAMAEREEARANREVAAQDRAAAAEERRTTRRRSLWSIGIAASGVAIAVIANADRIWSAVQAAVQWIGTVFG